VPGQALTGKTYGDGGCAPGKSLIAAAQQKFLALGRPRHYIGYVAVQQFTGPTSPTELFMPTNQDFAAAAKSNVELLLALSTKAFEAAEKLAALNLQVAKAGLADAAQASQAALSAKDPQAALAAQAGWVQPAAGKANEYASAVASIMSGTKAELDEILSASAADAKGAFAAMFEAALKNAPQGSEQAVTFWKSAIKGATDGFESLQNAAKQASEMAQANYATALSGTPGKAPKARR